MGIQKNTTLELLKLFASYMVVFIHVLFNGNTGIAVDALARFAVPFFLLVSGYCSYQIPADKIKKRIQNIASLLIFSSVCCTLFEIVKLLKYNRDGLAAFLNQYTDFGTYIDLLVWNVPVSSGHLWYLFAILYVYVIFYFVTKWHIKETIIFAVSLILLLLHLILGEGLSIFGIVLPVPFVRNFALMGIPFFAIGLFVKKYEDTFRKLPNYWLVALAVIGAAESVFSRFCFGENELYIGSLLVLSAIVCAFIKGANVQYPSFVTALDGCSTYIYIFHIMISSVLLILYGAVGINIYASPVLENLHPLLVCAASTITAYLFIKLLHIFKTKKTAR